MEPKLATIIAIICKVGQIKEIDPDEDLYEAGLSSIKVFSLLIELETSFGVTIPDDQFIHARTPNKISHVVQNALKDKSNG